MVYLLHGNPGEPKDWIGSGRANLTADALIGGGKLQPAILIMVQSSLDDGSGRDEQYGGPESGVWPRYVSRDLVSRVDRDYRTVASRRGRAIAGLSEGGYGATNLGLHDLDEFAVVGSFSGYFALSKNEPAVGGDGGLADANSPAVYLSNLEGPLPQIYMYVGASEGPYVSANNKFADALKAKGVSYEFRTYPGTHSWDLWRSRLPDFLVFASRNLKGGT